MFRRFTLDRLSDVTGISGTRLVALGVQFSDGTVVMRWLGDTRSTIIHASIANVEIIHCHNGMSVINWMDKDD